jgi:hypothetical protein
MLLTTNLAPDDGSYYRRQNGRRNDTEEVSTTMTNFKQRLLTAVAGLALVGGGLGCSTNAGTGALIGAGAGAGLGAIIGNNSHHRTGSGAAIGAGVGAIGGALIGNEIDKDQRRDRYHDRYDRDRYYDDRPDYYGRGTDGYWERRYYEDSDGRYYDSYRESRRY